jgi:hypothetical protein
VKGLKPAILLLSVALFAALTGHVVIDILGDFMLAHDTYDDMDHSSRTIVALVTLGLTILGIGLGFHAAIREARGSENAFCTALRGALPRSQPAFLIAAVVLATFVLCVMEGCDAWLAAHPVDDVGDLFGGSVPFGATIETIVATVISLVSLAVLRRLARARIIAGLVVTFLSRCVCYPVDGKITVEVRHRLVLPVQCVSRRIAGRAPPLLILVSTR